MAIKGSKALGDLAGTHTVEFDAGVDPGIKPTDTFASSGPVSFTVSVLGTSFYSGTAQSLIATGGSASDATAVRNFVAGMARELIRKGILKGTYTAS